MSLAIEVMANKFAAIAGELAAAMNKLTEDDARLLYQTARDTCPVDTGAMRDSHLVEEIEPGHWEVSVQKEAALAGERTYANYVNSGTIHMSAQPWFQDAIIAASIKMQSSTLEGVL